jgi:hypothetical protein
LHGVILTNPVHIGLHLPVRDAMSSQQYKPGDRVSPGPDDGILTKRNAKRDSVILLYAENENAWFAGPVAGWINPEGLPTGKSKRFDPAHQCRLVRRV